MKTLRPLGLLSMMGLLFLSAALPIDAQVSLQARTCRGKTATIVGNGGNSGASVSAPR